MRKPIVEADVTRATMLWVGKTILVAGSVLSVTGVSGAAGQSAVTAWPVTMESRHPVGFTSIDAVLDKRNGDVVVLDALERVVVLLTANLQTRRDLGRSGQGPGEYERPNLVFPLRGDAVGVGDRGASMAVFDAAGRFLQAVSLRGPAGVGSHSAVFSDTLGFLYALADPIRRDANGNASLGDSSAIERWSVGAASRDTVAFLPTRLGPEARLIGGRFVGEPTRPAERFPVGTQWLVSPDGRVARIHSSPYSVEIVEPDGGMLRSGPIATDPIPLSARLRDEWDNEQRIASSKRRSRVVVVGAGGAAVPPGLSIPPPPPRGHLAWPEVLPPVVYGSGRFGPDGLLWVQRWVAAGQPARCDVFDRTGHLVARVALPPGSRMVAAGAGALYVMRRDDSDLEYLEKYLVKR